MTKPRTRRSPALLSHPTTRLADDPSMPRTGGQTILVRAQVVPPPLNGLLSAYAVPSPMQSDAGRRRLRQAFSRPGAAAADGGDDDDGNRARAGRPWFVALRESRPGLPHLDGRHVRR